MHYRIHVCIVECVVHVVDGVISLWNVLVKCVVVTCGETKFVIHRPPQGEAL